MSEQSVINAITPVFQRVFDNDSLVVTRELTAREVPRWDSLNHITLVVELEELSGVTFTVEELASMTNVGDLIELLLRKGYTG